MSLKLRNLVPAIPEDLVDYFESGISVLVGTCDANRRPDATRSVGVLVHPKRERVTLFLSEHTSKRAVANLAQNGAVAVGFSRPYDHLSIQLKGKVVEVRPATEAERVFPERYLAGFSDQLHMTGFPRSLPKRIVVWPAVAVTFDLHDIFLQTPGPNAGSRFQTR